MTPSLRLEISSSRALCAATAMLHAAAGTTVLLLLPGWAAPALLTLIAASAVLGLRRYGFLTSPRSIIALQLQQNTLTLKTRAGASLSGKAAPTTFVSPLLTVVALARRGQILNPYAVIAYDNAAREDYRRLRVMLRWGDYRDIQAKGDAARDA